MKKLLGLNLLIVLSIIFASCGTNNNVVNNRLISKRKYNKGFHINRKGNMKSSKSEKEEEGIAFEDVKSSSTKTKKAENYSSHTEDNTRDRFVPAEDIQSNIIVREDRAEPASKPILRSSEAGLPSDEGRAPMADSQIQEDFQSSDNRTSSQEKMTKKQAKKKARAAARGGNSDLVNIILIVLLVCVILALLSFIGGTIGWILSVVVLVLIIYFLLKLLGAI
ncbi:MAG: hypothetical protein NXI10_11300 [bacterium]|nr:hypothetical protein [bacterium]